MENNNNVKFKITKDTNKNNKSFKNIDENNTMIKFNNKQTNNNNQVIKLPEWSIEPPLEIKRGDKQ